MISVCPEVLGGLPTPRPSAEIVGGSVVTVDGRDVTSAFELGATTVGTLATLHEARVAILKDGSPSCGSTFIYDGSFTGATLRGEGITASLLRSQGVAVFSEHQIEAAAEYLNSLEDQMIVR